jgi:hypothetical protein
MQPVSAICLFCEDIRTEANEVNTLVGILPDNLNVPGIPGNMPKLGMYVRINLDPAAEPCSISLELALPWGDVIPLGEIDQSLIAKARKDAQNSRAPVAGIISRSLFSPFPILGEGRIRAIAKIRDEPVTVGSLNIRLATSPTISSTAS